MRGAAEEQKTCDTHAPRCSSPPEPDFAPLGSVHFNASKARRRVDTRPGRPMRFLSDIPRYEWLARKVLINSVLAFVVGVCETARYARFRQSES